MKIIEQIKSLIRLDKTGEALDLLLEKYPSDNTSSMLLSQFNNLNREIINGTIKPEFAVLRLNGIKYNVLTFLDLIITQTQNPNSTPPKWLKTTSGREEHAEELADDYNNLDENGKEEILAFVFSIYIENYSRNKNKVIDFITKFDKYVEQDKKFFHVDINGPNIYEETIKLLKIGLPQVPHFYGLLKITPSDLLEESGFIIFLRILENIENHGYKSTLSFLNELDEKYSFNTNFLPYYYAYGLVYRKNNLFEKAIAKFKRGVDLIKAEQANDINKSLLLCELLRGIATVYRKKSTKTNDQDEAQKFQQKADEHYLKAKNVFDEIEESENILDNYGVREIGSDIYFSYGYFKYEIFFTGENSFIKDRKRESECEQIKDLFEKSYSLNPLFTAPMSRVGIINLFLEDWASAYSNFLIVKDADQSFLKYNKDSERLMTSLWVEVSLYHLHSEFRIGSDINQSLEGIKKIFYDIQSKEIAISILECHLFDFNTILRIFTSIDRKVTERTIISYLKLLSIKIEEERFKKIVVKDKKIKVLLVGAGQMGIKYHYPIFQKDKQIQITGTIKSNPESFNEIPSYRPQQLEEVIKANQPELVIISSPHKFHFIQCKIALENSCNVLCEKPLAFNLDEVQELVNLANQKNRLLVVNLQRRYEGPASVFYELYKNGEFGEIKLVQGLFSHQFNMDTHDMGGWRLDPEIAGAGIIEDSAFHLIDLLILFSGGGAIKKSFSGFYISRKSIPHTFSCQFTTKKGVIVSAAGSYITPQNSVQEEISILGTKGSLFIRRFKKEWNQNPPELVYKSYDGSKLINYDLNTIPFGRHLPLYNFINFIKGDTHIKDILTQGKDVLETHKVISWIKESTEIS